MEEEVRDILRLSVSSPKTPHNLGQAIHARFAALGGVDLEPPSRGSMRDQPDFG